MRHRSAQRMKFILTVVLLVGIVWVGYWVGYGSFKKDQNIILEDSFRSGHRKLGYDHPDDYHQERKPIRKGVMMSHKDKDHEDDIQVLQMNRELKKRDHHGLSAKKEKANEEKIGNLMKEAQKGVEKTKERNVWKKNEEQEIDEIKRKMNKGLSDKRKTEGKVSNNRVNAINVERKNGQESEKSRSQLSGTREDGNKKKDDQMNYKESANQHSNNVKDTIDYAPKKPIKSSTQMKASNTNDIKMGGNLVNRKSKLNGRKPVQTKANPGQNIGKSQYQPRRNKLDSVKSSRTNKGFELSGGPKKPIGLSNKSSGRKKPWVESKFDRERYVLIHKGLATIVHKKLNMKPQVVDDEIPKEAYTFQTDKLPLPRFMPSVGNGHISTVVFSDSVFMNGLYNGYRTESHRAQIPSTCAYKVVGVEPEAPMKRSYSLNVLQGVFTETIDSPLFQVKTRVFAHRNLTRLLVLEIELTRHSAVPVTLKLKNFGGSFSSQDLSPGIKDSGIKGVEYKYGTVNAAETEKAEHPNAHVYYDEVPEELTPPKGLAVAKWVFLTSISPLSDDAHRAYKQGAKLVVTHDYLYHSHVLSWAQLWNKSRIDVEGNLKLSQAVYSSMYYLFSSMPIRDDPIWPFFGLGPTDLAHGRTSKDYNGHVFWDQEIWMYPPLLMFNSEMGRILLKSRTRTLQAARLNAKLHGLKGALFPWESAFTGEEVSPSESMSKGALHINGDIAFAVRQYLYATRDTALIREEANLIIELASFWASKAKFCHQKMKFEIRDVMPPDEFHYPVNNSVYTNVVAQLALRLPSLAFRLLSTHNLTTQTQWKHIANNMYIPYDSKEKYHPEYDGYRSDAKTRVQSADAILLNYPLMYNMTDEIIRNDLKKYALVTDPSTPPMTWSMFAIGYLQLKDISKAESYFEKNYQHIKEPFKIWSEAVAGNDAVNFLSGMGGFLQAVLNGYGGLRLRETRLDIDPVLPPHTSRVNLVGIDYLGCSLDIYISDQSTTVTLTEVSGDVKLSLFDYQSMARKPLFLGRPVKNPRGKIAVMEAGLRT